MAGCQREIEDGVASIFFDFHKTVRLKNGNESNKCECNNKTMHKTPYYVGPNHSNTALVTELEANSRYQIQIKSKATASPFGTEVKITLSPTDFGLFFQGGGENAPTEVCVNTKATGKPGNIGITHTFNAPAEVTVFRCN